MLSLRDLQSAFSRAVFERDERALADWIEPGEKLSAAARIDVYRNNVLGNYRSALKDVYPAIQSLVGERFFDGAATQYARLRPSRSGDLHDFGEGFGAFLRSWPPAKELVYLGDVADLEWAMHRVFHAADVGPLDLAALAGVSCEALASLRFRLNPAARPIASSYPMLNIWQAAQPGAASDRTVSLDDGPDDLLVIRRRREVQIERLSAGELALLDALAHAAALGEAFDRAAAVEPGLDLSACLQRHVLGLTLVEFYR